MLLYLPVMMQPRPWLSLMLVFVIQNLAGGSPPPILVWPSSSCPTVPLWPPEAVRWKQHVEVQGLALAAIAIASRIATYFMIGREQSWILILRIDSSLEGSKKE